MAQKAKEQNQGTTKSLAQEVMEKANPGYPSPTTLSLDEKSKIEEIVEKIMTPLYRSHQGNISDFDFDMKKNVTDVVKAQLQWIPSIYGSPSKTKAALNQARDLAQQWGVYIRNSELFKMLNQSIRST